MVHSTNVLQRKTCSQRKSVWCVKVAPQLKTPVRPRSRRVSQAVPEGDSPGEESDFPETDSSF
ncbi:hypothetical protein [Moorena sp. SIO3H5]|uniref:hypothetical protein n=1 Tax=Moorena sp. SIO3H5 TaxID=2607834 RepID=UPI0013BC8295|nr:hypothetical protein [Moorena sp. SIO3H5]NEO73276.1 hypothetical protein [Moorena sp. SIO3H5]